MLPGDLLQAYNDIAMFKGALSDLTAAEVAQDLIDLHVLMGYIRDQDGTVEEFFKRIDKGKRRTETA